MEDKTCKKSRQQSASAQEREHILERVDESSISRERTSMLSKDPRSRRQRVSKKEVRPLLARRFLATRPPHASAALRLRVRPVRHGRGSGRVSTGPKNTKRLGQSTQKTQGKTHHFQTQKWRCSRHRPLTPIEPSKRPFPGAPFCCFSRRPAGASSHRKKRHEKRGPRSRNATLAQSVVRAFPRGAAVGHPFQRGRQ